MKKEKVREFREKVVEMEDSKEDTRHVIKVFEEENKMVEQNQ